MTPDIQDAVEAIVADYIFEQREHLLKTPPSLAERLTRFLNRIHRLDLMNEVAFRAGNALYEFESTN